MPRSAPDTGQATSQDNVELVRDVHLAVLRGDLESIISVSHPDVEYHAATQQALEGESGVFLGHDGVARWLRELHDLYEDLTSEIIELRDLGQQVLVVFVVRARGTGSGITLDQTLAQVVTVRQGQVVEVREYFSREEALEAAGRA